MPPWIYTVLGRRWFWETKRNGGSANQSRRFIGAGKCVCCTTAFFFCCRSADRRYYVLSISVLMVTISAYKQVNFGLQNCKLTKKADDFVSKPPAL
jgi:hypothetical protein